MKILGNLTISGDMAIRQLFQANADRIKKAQTDAAPFLDVYDFVARIRDNFPEHADFGLNAGQLFEDLSALGFDTPTKVRSAFLATGYRERSEALLTQPQDYLHQENDDGVQIEAASSDALLVLVLESNLDQVLGSGPHGAGPRTAPQDRKLREPLQTVEGASGDGHSSGASGRATSADDCRCESPAGAAGWSRMIQARI